MLDLIVPLFYRENDETTRRTLEWFSFGQRAVWFSFFSTIVLTPSSIDSLPLLFFSILKNMRVKNFQYFYIAF